MVSGPSAELVAVAVVVDLLRSGVVELNNC